MNSALPSTLKITLAIAATSLLWGCGFESGRAGETPAADKAAAASNPPAATAAAAPSVAPATSPALEAPGPVKPLPEPLRELVKMAERGLGDELLIAWVKSSAAKFELTSDDIVYLTDLGISEDVIKALIEHKGGGTATPRNPDAANLPAVAASPTTPINPPVGQLAPSLTPAPANPAPGATVTATPEFEANPAPQPQPQTQTVYVPQPAPVQVNYFYSSLAPYGSWIDVDGYGLCWRPTVALVDVGWRPYCHGGRWVYTNCGWYWQSDYTWGWAPFHYGRWHHHHRSGWVWAPDSVWSPAWVTWRYSNSYCGWAPLPPGAHYRSGIGLTYHTGNVSVGFDFGLGYAAYTFVPAHRFCDRTPWRHRVSHDHHASVYNQTTVINNITVNSNNTIVNEGLGRDRIAALTRSEVPKVTLRDQPPDNARLIKSDRLERGGKELAVYRPLNPTVPSAPSGATTAPAGRNEAPKNSVAASPRGASVEPPRSSVIPSSRPVAPGVISSHSPAGAVITPRPATPDSSASSLANAPTTPATLGAKPTVESRESRSLSGSRPGNSPVPTYSAPAPTVPSPTVSSPVVTTKPSVEQRGPIANYTPINPSPTRPAPRLYSPAQPAGTIPSPAPAPAGNSPSISSTPVIRSTPSIARNINPPIPVTPTPNSSRQISVPSNPVPSPTYGSVPRPNYQPAPVQRSYQPARPAPAPMPSAPPSYRQEVAKPAFTAPPSPSYSAPAPVPSYRAPASIPSQPAPNYAPRPSIQSMPNHSAPPAPRPVAPSGPPALYSAPAPRPAPQPSSSQASPSNRQDRNAR